ncbi:MAG: hypothetical protein M3162_05870 [Thermoproteota archaeon]|nr:hypothetical protein [Thermoproteota archaeon]
MFVITGLLSITGIVSTITESLNKDPSHKMKGMEMDGMGISMDNTGNENKLVMEMPSWSRPSKQ